MAENKRIGHIRPDGSPDYPQESISGRPFEMPPTQVKLIGSGDFVVLDIFPPAGFDLDAELAKLRPAPAGKKTEPVSEKAL